MSRLSYVRREMLPQQEPPVTEVGIIKWVRENLFSGVLNSILTVLSVLFIGWVILHIWEWFYHSVWYAGSLSECREIIADTYGEGAEGACFAVITERWNQLLFGFYPSELYWRPVLAFVLMFVALAPILFTGAPRKLMYFTLIYPALAYWLLWGGTVFTPILIMFGFVLGYLVVKFLGRIAPLIATILAILVPIVWWLMLMGPTLNVINGVIATMQQESYIEKQADVVENYQTLLDSPDTAESDISRYESKQREAQASLERAIALPQIREDLEVATAEAERLRAALPDLVKDVTSREELDEMTVDIPDEDRALLEEALTAEDLVLQVTSAKQSVEADVGRIGFVPVPSDDFGGFMLAFIIGITGIAFSLPLGILLALGRQSNLFLIRTICVGFIEFIRGVPLITLLFTASLLLNYFLPPGTNFDIILRVIIMVTLFSAAYIAEVVRGGLAALPRGQYEAADALGLDYWKAQRLIIMPQALKISIPGIVSSFIGLFKDTTLVVFIGLLDPIGLSNSIRATTEWNGIYWELFIFIGLLFWIVCFGMSRYSMYLERKLKTGH